MSYLKFYDGDKKLRRKRSKSSSRRKRSKSSSRRKRSKSSSRGKRSKRSKSPTRRKRSKSSSRRKRSKSSSRRKRSKSLTRRKRSKSSSRRTKRRFKRNIIDGMSREDAKQLYDNKRIQELKIYIDIENFINVISPPKKIRNNHMYKLLGWINEVMVYEEGMERDWFYGTINYLKRYIMYKREISLRDFQLIGIVCLMISNKIYGNNKKFGPEYELIDWESELIGSEFISSVTNDVDGPVINTVEAINAMERDIFFTLNWTDLDIPTPQFFLEMYVDQLIPLTEEENIKAQFLLEIAIFHYLNNYLPSVLALAIILVTKDIKYTDLEDGVKTFLGEINEPLLNKYIDELESFYTEKFRDNYELSIENLFKTSA